ncbi:MAG: tetratricopeptide repeat-containing glycosyltransferase family protein [Desulfobacterales bacterium]|nr:tetratricopeptide repeat-containing glycosyltransferase family protein [Desulfobacterales bacterium]
MTDIQQILQTVVQHLSGGNLHEAEKGCRQVLTVHPDNPDALHILGVIAFNVGKLDAARELISKAISLFPNNPSFYTNLGNVHQACNEAPEAIDQYKKSLALNPNNPHAYTNLGVAYKAIGLRKKAMATFDAALPLFEGRPNFESDPGYADCRLNRGLIHLVEGNFAAGWPEFEWRFNSSNTNRTFPGGTVWEGQAFPGKTLLVYEEQGHGDTIQFLRFLPILKGLGGDVILEASPALVRLFSSFDGFDRLWIRNDSKDTRDVDQFDLKIPMMSLPRVLNTTLDTLPSEMPYLKADDTLTRIWGERLAGKTGLKVGVCWAGSPVHKNDRNRSIPLSYFSELASMPGISLFSLQLDRYERWTDTDPSAIFDLDLGEDISDFADTAAILANLDLLISVDTSVVHLAGALGTRVWTLLPFVPDWRWLLDREDSPWYPGMRLFRQKGPGEWKSVFGEIRSELTRMVR